jgi:hypothetical protein
MQYFTDKGEFATLQEMRFAYLKSGEHIRLDPGHAGMDEWESDKLHASEVGSCARMQMLRLQGAPKKVQANLTQANDAILFWVAYRLHYLTYEAMQWAGILVGFEVSLFDGLWAGRADAIITPDVNDKADEWLYDAKTTRPNAFKYTESFPKDQHCLQVATYGVKKTNISKAIIEYIDRGGSNPPVECVIDLERWHFAALDRMNVLEQYRVRALEGDGELPPLLEEVYVPHYRKARGMDYKDLKSVTLECSWECGYCAFHHTFTDDATRPESPCKPPNHSPIEVAKVRTQKEGGGWAFSAGAAGMSVSGIQQVIATFTPRVPVIGGDEE